MKNKKAPEIYSANYIDQHNLKVVASNKSLKCMHATVNFCSFQSPEIELVVNTSSFIPNKCSNINNNYDCSIRFKLINRREMKMIKTKKKQHGNNR